MVELGRTEKTRLIVDAALDRKAEEVVALDVSALTSYADVFIVMSGRSDRQVRSIADHVARTLKDHGEPPMGMEGLNDGRWVLLDCDDVIVHVFDPETRFQYDLERLWHDAPRIEFGTDGEARTVDSGSAGAVSQS